MSLFRIAYRSITQRGVASLLTMFSMALGVMLVVAVLSIHGVVSQSFRNNASLGYNMIVGAKGGQEQLVLNTVFYLSKPVENIPYTYYLEFLKRDERDRQLPNSFAAECHAALIDSAELLSATSGDGPSNIAVDRSINKLGLALGPDTRVKSHHPPVELGVDGKYGRMTELAIPVCLGDYFGSFRVVGTIPALFDELVYDIENKRKYEFAVGRNFHERDAEHGFFEAVVGATVARQIRLTELHLKLENDTEAAIALISNHVNWARIEKRADAVVVTLGQGVEDTDFALAFRRLQKKLDDGETALSPASKAALSALLKTSTIVRRSTRRVTVGDAISPRHGDPEGHAHARKFTVVGILRPSGTPNDRAVFVNMEGFYLMEGHANPVEEAQPQSKDDSQQPKNREEWLKLYAAESKKKAQIEHIVDPDPLPIEQREITALLLKVPYQLAPGLENGINEGTQAQAVLPIEVIYRLFESIVNPIQWTLLLLTAMICIVSGISILVSIYNSMSERRGEIAIMRALGAGRGTVMTIILLEATLLALGGGFLGWVAGHLGCLAMSPLIVEQTGVRVGLGLWEPAIRVLSLIGITGSAAESLTIPLELLLIPALVLLAILVGIWPAISAYRTDVAKSLGK